MPARFNVSTPDTPGPRSGHEAARVGPYAVDHAFEHLLARANRAWAAIEADLIADAPAPIRPLVIICYPPRSGSTLLAQLLARSGAFNYVSNFVARFWEAPYLAGLLERRLGLRDAAFPDVVTSDYGVTPAPNEPHEFGFFWNRWLAFRPGTHCIDEARMPEAHTRMLRREVHALMSLYPKPFFIKSDLVGLNAAFFSRLFETARFVVLRRDPRYVARSIYQARLDLYGDAGVYWSTRPSNALRLAALPVPEQIAGQIQGIYDDIYDGLRAARAPFLEVTYEQVCRHPAREVLRILQFAGVEVDLPPAALPPRQSGGNRPRLPAALLKQLDAAVKKVSAS